MRRGGRSIYSKNVLLRLFCVLLYFVMFFSMITCFFITKVRWLEYSTSKVYPPQVLLIEESAFMLC